MTTLEYKTNLGIRRLIDVRNELVDIYNTASYYGKISFEDTKILYAAIKPLNKFIDKLEKENMRD